MQPGRREEVFNTVLAACLATHGLEADPETILKGGRARPDVMANFRGLRCAVEGKVADAPGAKRAVVADAKNRIEQGIAHLAIAVVYPVEIRTAEFASLQKTMVDSTLTFAVLTESEIGNWHEGGVGELVAELRRAHDVIVRDDVLQQAVDTLNIGLAEVADALLLNRGACDRLIGLLGVGTTSSAASTI
jgi:hypothetical protein